jgi:hypothetical protein
MKSPARHNINTGKKERYLFIWRKIGPSGIIPEKFSFL